MDEGEFERSEEACTCDWFRELKGINGFLDRLNSLEITVTQLSLDFRDVKAQLKIKN